MPVLKVKNNTNKKLGTNSTFGDIGPYQEKSKELTVAQVESLRPFLIRMTNAGLVVFDVGDYSSTHADTEFITAQDAGTGTGTGGINVLDEGILLGPFTDVNFIGATVFAAGSVTPGQVNVFIPPPSFKSHWDANDGSNGSQTVSESITRQSVRISTPSGGEGSPFAVNGWDGSNHSATLNTIASFTTSANTTGWGGDSTMTVEVIDADTITVIDSFTTPVITANGTHVSPSTDITVTIANFGPDSTRAQAKATVTVGFSNVLTTLGRTGGRFHVKATHTTDSATDGSGPFVYTQSEVFLDTNPTTPVISGAVTMTQGVTVITKQLSGIEYYRLGSQFAPSALTIDELNANSQRPLYNLLVSAPSFGLTNIQAAGYPGNAEAANFTNWTNNENQNGVDYSKNNWAISQTSYRFAGAGAVASFTPEDPWANGAAKNSAPWSMLIDTYVDDSTDLFEDFNGEDRREDPTSFPGAGLWDSTANLVASEAAVFGGKLVVPLTTFFIPTSVPNANWTGYSPNPGLQPDYSGLSAPVAYGRRFKQAPGTAIPSFSMVFSGTFAAGNALADLNAGNIEIDIYRIAVPTAVPAAFGPPPGNTQTLRVHVPFNFAVYDDGLTFAGSGIREGSSVGNTINCTFGTGTPADTGMYCVIRILNIATSIDSVTTVFF